MGARIMTTPLWTYRVPLEQQAVLKRIADALKRDPTLAPRLEAALEHQAGPSATAVGPFKNEEAALAFIRDRLVLDLDPESVWLFGSRGRGDHCPAIEFCILIVFPDEL